MRFSVEIGHSEKKVIEYEFRQLLGKLTIRINGELAKQRVRLFNEPAREVHEFYFDAAERTTVRIEKERKTLFGQRNRVYVNDRLLRVFEGV